MRHLEELKEKYKDGWWEGHDGYTGDEMCSDIQYLIFVVGEYKEAFEKGYVRGRQANVRIGELLNENKGLKGEIGNCYSDLNELQEDKKELEKLAFDLGKENDQLRKRNEEILYHQSQMQTVIDTYEEALQQIVDIGNKTFKTESEVIAGKVLKFYEE